MVDVTAAEVQKHYDEHNKGRTFDVIAVTPVKDGAIVLAVVDGKEYVTHRYFPHSGTNWGHYYHPKFKLGGNMTPQQKARAVAQAYEDAFVDYQKRVSEAGGSIRQNGGYFGRGLKHVDKMWANTLPGADFEGVDISDVEDELK